MDRIEELSKEIKAWLKTNPESKKIKLLQTELNELLVRKRVSPTSFDVKLIEKPKLKKS
jgi:hypothetical protein